MPFLNIFLELWHVNVPSLSSNDDYDDQDNRSSDDDYDDQDNRSQTRF